jgi:hypothetical protein
MRELPKSGAHSFGCASDFFRGDREFLAEMQLDGNAALERAGANLGALQVGDYGYGFFVVSGSTANGRDPGGMFFGFPMGKVQTRDIHPSPYQAIN